VAVAAADVALLVALLLPQPTATRVRAAITIGVRNVVMRCLPA
jgi:hypothetical protein